MDKRYDFKTEEKELEKMWAKHDIYKYQQGRNGKVFSIDTPPPTVSGKLHIGHVFSYTQAEIIARFKRMQGFDVFYPFGFDDNGLPTERLVEKTLNIKASDLSRSEFQNHCIQTVKTYENDFKSLWQRLGFSVDWTLQFQTISSVSQKISQKSFLELVKMKKAYLKESPVLWCTECQTSIAQAELESKECDTTTLLPMDQWILQRINETMRTVTKLLDEYEIGQARHEIDTLFWKDFCDYYIEIAKERLYQPEKHGIKQRYSGQYALYHGLLQILKLYAIYTPYITDSIYQKFYREYEESISIHQLQWNTFETKSIYIEFGEHVKEVIGEVRKKKTEQQKSMKDGITELMITCPKKFRKFYIDTELYLKACTGAEKIVVRS